MSCLMTINSSRYARTAELLQLKKDAVKTQAKPDSPVQVGRALHRALNLPAVPVPTTATASQFCTIQG